MSVSVKTLGIDRLNVDEQLALVEEIWATLCADAEAFPLTDESVLFGGRVRPSHLCN